MLASTADLGDPDYIDGMTTQRVGEPHVFREVAFLETDHRLYSTLTTDLTVV